MEHLKLNNFRVFSKTTSFDLAPVTILTGRNNSGKSSLIKSFLVLADYLESADHTTLRLDGLRAHKHRINSFDALRNWSARPEEQVCLAYQNDGCCFEYAFDAHTERGRGELASLKVTIAAIGEELTLIRQARGTASAGSTRIEDLTIQETAEPYGADTGCVYRLTVSQRFVQYLTASIKERQAMAEPQAFKQRLEEAREQLRQISERANAAAHDSLGGQVRPINYQKLLAERQDAERQVKRLEAAANASQQIATGVLYDQEIQPGERGYGSLTIPGMVMQGLLSFQDSIGGQRQGYRFKADQQEARDLIRFQQTLRRLMTIAPFHLGPNRTHQAHLIFSQHTGSELASVVTPFLSGGIPESSLAARFLRYWLKEFRIGESVRVEAVEGTAFKVLVKQPNQKEPVNLADMGYGAGQLLVVLLQIAAVLHRIEFRQPGAESLPPGVRPLILVEEPEANLHPWLQSELARLFVTTAGIHKVQFIVEVHSEYLIRKLQLMVADDKDKCTADDAVLYYLQADEPTNHSTVNKAGKALPNDNLLGRQITFGPDGKLSDEFGPGFFNEADEKAMALFRIQKKAMRNQSPSTSL